MKLYLLIALFSLPVWADSTVNAVDDDVRSDLHRLADRIDEIFGATRADNNKSSSTLRLSAQETIENKQADDPAFGIRFNLKLATLQRWNEDLNRWWQRQIHKAEEDFESDNKKNSSTPQPDGSSAEAKTSEKRDPWRFSIDKRLKIARDSSFEARVLTGKDFETKNFLHSFLLDGGWSTSDLWVSRMSLTTSHHLNPTCLLTFGNSLDWAISHKTFTTSHGPELSWLMKDHQAAFVALGVGTTLQVKNWSAQSYTISSGYRVETWHNQIYFSFNPYLTFTRENRFVGNPGLFTSLELVL